MADTLTELMLDPARWEDRSGRVRWQPRHPDGRRLVVRRNGHIGFYVWTRMGTKIGPKLCLTRKGAVRLTQRLLREERREERRKERRKDRELRPTE